ncbi:MULTISPECIES: hypothetical protein [Pseudomonas syringae group]|uniref:hypothetical protein n=1 Tax=Pseudomonas syringae group TaxID=136849 RepID=UPI0005A4CB4B|nr:MULTISPECIES: hypothetical protein [Pseudomonas syringae group]KGS12146.1 hypothetical protein OA77_23375 [Pseudomonas coronafaciens]KPW51720.1 hypothetical protein ALO86_101522 [Pseudomonas syringae pv. berberidis]RMP62510.1 hypothetical protein ALQ19_101778 [Pseudomonas syringae pv. berberidis]RMQ39658.1 hypothetical protein ALQ06_101721 [Pseudomonas syringae pv. berberidis]RMV09838.1 hypothetical protein ALP20_101773 [Pseudomonas coronafaciens pv. coronafaciens]
MDHIHVAHAFRAELEKQKTLDQLPCHLKSFPRGCCGVVSELLGDYLNAQLGLQVEYVCGEKDGGSHAWVELKGVVIDITSDQFEGRPPVYIAARDSWYTSWEEESRHLAVHHPSAWTYREEREVLRAVLRGAGLPNSDL